MWMKKLVKVAQYERALVYRDRNLEAVLTPGKYRLARRELEVATYDVSVAELVLPRADVLVAEARALLEPAVQIVELGDREVGLVYKNGRLAGVLAPGARQLYWRGPVDVRVDVRTSVRRIRAGCGNRARAEAHRCQRHDQTPWRCPTHPSAC